jgi:agmatine deiminase
MKVRLPAEVEPQRSVWLTWPGNPATWTHSREAVRRDHAHLVALCARFQPVDLICPAAWQPDCRQHLAAAGADDGNLTLHDWPVNDAWTRDHGPVFVQTDAGPSVVDLPYNAWGGKFPPWEDDDRVAGRVSELRNLPCHRFPMFGEGGGLESDGQGTLLVTESVWLNPNRNPGVSRRDLEEAFRQAFGSEEVIWLRGGMALDDTDGHIDTLARFVRPGTVMAACPLREDPDYGQLMQNREQLAATLEVVDLPHPGMPDRPASYLNALFLNGAVLVPVYGCPQDEQACACYREYFPDREVIPVLSAVFVEEGGAVHCLTQNEWA